jgi:hypothetical protein
MKSARLPGSMRIQRWSTTSGMRGVLVQSVAVVRPV